MIDIDAWIQKSKCPVKIIMQVHDELVFEIHENFVDEAVEKINEIMSNPLKLSVPLLVEVGVNENWGDAH